LSPAFPEDESNYMPEAKKKQPFFEKNSTKISAGIAGISIDFNKDT
jgi:hypothetical protein